MHDTSSIHENTLKARRYDEILNTYPHLNHTFEKKNVCKCLKIYFLWIKLNMKLCK